MLKATLNQGNCTTGDAQKVFSRRFGGAGHFELVRTQACQLDFIHQKEQELLYSLCRKP